MIMTPPKNSKHTISFNLSSQQKKLRPIISDTQATIDIRDEMQLPRRGQISNLTPPQQLWSYLDIPNLYAKL